MAVNLGRETLTYDSVGNIKTLVRTGTSSTVVDQLTYDYGSWGNRLKSVADANISTNAAYQLPGTTTYTYDANGNMKSRVNTTSTAHNISSMVYNYLNLPQTVTIPSGTITYTYDGTGRKLKTVGGGITTEYIDGIEWQNSTLNLVHTDEGRAVNTGSAYAYEYFLKDHLGNTRSGFSDQNPTAVNLKSDYYPFGLQYQSGIVAPNPKNRYLYNGKELQDGSNLYDYGARSYDPVIGRWNAVDEMAENHYETTSYNYVLNNPMSYIDPLGLDTLGINNNASAKAGDVLEVDNGYATASSDEAVVTAPINTTAKGERSPNSIYTMRDKNVDYITLLNEFLHGVGPEYSGFDSEHPMTKDLENSWIVQLATIEFLRNNQEPLRYYDVPFGVVGSIMSGTNMTSQFIGGARVSIIRTPSGYVYTVNNTTDKYSGGYHSMESVPRAPNFITPGGTIYQRFMWIKNK